jgi:hypothetical protein
MVDFDDASSVDRGAAMATRAEVDHSRKVFNALVAACLIGATVSLSQLTIDLDLPYDIDLFRDIAQADEIRRGNVFSDANYSGETSWYPPLGSWLVGGLARLTGEATAVVLTRGGVFVNLIGALALTALTRRWFGRTAAGFTLIAYVFFFAGSNPSWAVASLSPWLFQSNLAQGPFLVALWALTTAVTAGGRRPWIGFGLAVGLTTLAHPAPGIVLAVIALAATLRYAWRDSTSRAALAAHLATSGMIAVIVAAPFWLPILMAYRFQVRNSAPSEFLWDRLTVEQLPRFAADFVTRWPLIVGAAGLVVWAFRRGWRPISEPLQLLMWWTGAAGLLLLTTIAASSDRPVLRSIPEMVPAHHFLVSLTLAGTVWFGIGADALVSELSRRFDRRIRLGIAVGIAAIMVAITYPTWLDRGDLKRARSISQNIEVEFGGLDVSDWISENTPRDSIVVYALTGNPALFANALDQRKTTVVDNRSFSNPYVDWQARYDQTLLLIEAVRTCDTTVAPQMSDLAPLYFVVSSEDSLVTTQPACDLFEEVYSDSFAAVLTVK